MTGVLVTTLALVLMGPSVGVGIPRPRPIGVVPPVAVVGSDSTQPLLTVEALTKMTTFWAAFMQEPPAIRDTAQTKYQTVFPADFSGIANAPPLDFHRVDMEALAAQYPAVAADFKRAGLTPHEWTAYRRALYTAMLLGRLPDLGISVNLPSSDVRAKNIAFLRTYQKELDALRTSGMELPL